MGFVDEGGIQYQGSRTHLSDVFAYLLLRYEEEIARLRQQLEQVQSRSSNHPPIVAPAPMSSPANLGHPSSSQQPPPPNIGPGSNYFDGIMNAHGNNQGASPGLVAPSQMTGDNHHPAYPPPPPGYMNGSPAMNQSKSKSNPIEITLCLPHLPSFYIYIYIYCRRSR